MFVLLLPVLSAITRNACIAIARVVDLLVKLYCLLQLLASSTMLHAKLYLSHWIMHASTRGHGRPLVRIDDAQDSRFLILLLLAMYCVFLDPFHGLCPGSPHPGHGPPYHYYYQVLSSAH